MAEKKAVNLALQGGGAHGAFAWGMLDRFIDDGRLDIEGISATSAGTMNAVVYAYGKMRGGPEGAREALHNFWYNVSQEAARFNPIVNTPFEPYFSNNWQLDPAIAHFLFETTTRVVSPYQFNPFDYNPLRNVLERSVDFDELVFCKCSKLFITATNVHSGKVRVFHNQEITLDVALASACLPYLFKAIEIEGAHYWDGGYMGNPSLFPLFYETDSRDIVIFHINPIEREEVPKNASEINNRINEITFNSSLIKDLRAVAFVQKLLERDLLKEEAKTHFRKLYIHSIRADQVLCDLSVESKFDTSWDFLLDLFERGREAAAIWLEAHFDQLGKASTVDLHKEFLDVGYKIAWGSDDLGEQPQDLETPESL